MRPLLPICCLLVSGCATTRNYVAPQLVPAADVIRQVKYEIGKFAAETSRPVTQPGSCLANFALTVGQADIELTTTNASATDASIGAQVPLNLGSIGGGVATSSATTNTQSLKLVLHFDDEAARPASLVAPKPVWEGEPFYRAMTDVRSAIIAASDQQPCVGFDPDNSVSFGFTAERKASVNGSLSLFVLTLGANHSQGGSAAHSVTLHFHAIRGARAVVGAAR